MDWWAKRGENIVLTPIDEKTFTPDGDGDGEASDSEASDGLNT